MRIDVFYMLTHQSCTKLSTPARNIERKHEFQEHSLLSPLAAPLLNSGTPPKIVTEPPHTTLGLKTFLIYFCRP